MSDRHRVPLEHAGLLPIVVLLLLGSSSTYAAVSSLAAPEPTSAPPVVAPPPSPVASSAPSVAASAAPIAAVAEPKPMGPCAPRVSVLFTLGEGTTGPGIPPRLAPFAKFLVDHPDTTVTVSGHADATGSDDSNIALSHRRARSVAKLLEDAGVAKSRMTVRGFGAFQPLEGSDEAAPDNRRVILRVRGMPSCDQLPEEVIAP